jgi:uncharacterized membrane protein YcaP (DUF421 family)
MILSKLILSVKDGNIWYEALLKIRISQVEFNHCLRLNGIVDISELNHHNWKLISS